ncbi:hypothetical protein LWI29_029981 [Acer saccharum]|uniref:Protein FAR1-RELATED SEQUENCE n=1 Tax=Acer saccharum TaxID=4024 RepID=A0AA39VRR6_ACESA|nr:hypothetical protein LWI29_029981 [Acer saccharum]
MLYTGERDEGGRTLHSCRRRRCTSTDEVHLVRVRVLRHRASGSSTASLHVTVIVAHPPTECAWFEFECFWSISSSSVKKVGILYHEEFDSTWMTIIGKSKLVDNGWLQSIYEIRSKWVPVYVNHVFFAGISSSQRVESSHAFFKRFVYKRNSSVDFITWFNRAIARQRREELTTDHVNINEKPVSKMSNLIEKQMAETYTNKNFLHFNKNYGIVSFMILNL